MAKFKTTKSTNAIVDERGKVCWIDLMRKFTNEKKTKCKIAEKPVPLTENVLKKMATGATYEGTMDTLGMCGYGAYEFPYDSNNVMYEGNFEDGDFHGEGEYRYKDGTVLRGDFNKGAMTNRSLYFSDGLIYTEGGWLYCQSPDRRYTIEYEEGIQPSGASFITSDQPTREIEPELYDVGYGIFDPRKRVVSKYEDLTKLIRAPSKNERKWIEDNCRDGRDEPLGPMPFLYETYNDPELLLPELPKPAAKSTMSFEYYDDDDYLDEECRKSRRSTIGAKFKAKFFYKYDRPKAISFRSSTSLTAAESSLGAPRMSNQPESRSSLKYQTTQIEHTLRNRPDL